MERTVILAFGVAIVLALMFVAGNYQGFSDVTQLQVLRVLQTLSGAVTLAAAAVSVMHGIEAAVYRRWRYAVRVVGYLVVSGIALTLAIGSSGLLVLFQPL